MHSCVAFDPSAYNSDIESLRDGEYPSLKGVTYLDHGGSTIPAKSLLRDAAFDLSTNLYGNPHSASAPSALAGRRIDETRIQALRFFDADPQYFDLVFVANATAALKLVMDAFRDYCEATQTLSRPERRKFWYGYHSDAHNSLIGIREAADGGHRCFELDHDVDEWIHGAKDRSAKKGKQLRLFGYCGQSNMTGRRLPLRWPSQIRHSPHTSDVHVVFDAAALATTAPLDFSDVEQAPDFTCLSFYKIFGFPDLGALIVRKSSPGSRILLSRRYFGGGTVDMVTCLGPSVFHAKKTTTPHDHLEDGTLPFHSILALSAAITTHARLFTSMVHVSRHTAALTRHLHARLTSLRHANGSPLALIYTEPANTTVGDPATQGATIAFNVLRPDGTTIVAPSAVERAADGRSVYLRSGSLCNPGGAARHLGWSSEELRALYEDGLRCSRPAELVGGRPTGVVRCSLGAVSTIGDVDAFVQFLEEAFVDCVGDVGPSAEVEGDRTDGGAGASARASADTSVVKGKKQVVKRRRNGVVSLFLSYFCARRERRDGVKV